MPYFYWFDNYYLVLVLPAILISLIAQIMVKSSFNKYSKVSCLTLLDRSNKAIKLGIIIKPLNVSAINQTTSSFKHAPIMINRMNKK